MFILAKPIFVDNDLARAISAPTPSSANELGGLGPADMGATHFRREAVAPIAHGR